MLMVTSRRRDQSCAHFLSEWADYDPLGPRIDKNGPNRSRQINPSWPNLVSVRSLAEKNLSIGTELLNAKIH